MKKSPLKRKSKSPIKKLKDELWELCKQITRAIYKKKDGTWVCFTCGKPIDVPMKAQTGHFIASATCGAFLRYDLRNLRIQDYFCNINLGGNGATFYKNLVEEKGQEYVDQLFRDKQVVIDADEFWYREKIDEYKEILKKLSTDDACIK